MKRKERPLSELNAQQWEALCDGCAKCCLHKLEDADTGDVFYTKVRCRHLDEQACRCTEYERRSILVPDCIQLAPGTVGDLGWLPSTCAYRLRAAGPMPRRVVPTAPGPFSSCSSMARWAGRMR